MDEEGGAATLAVQAARPRRNLASLISAVEDRLAEIGLINRILVVDQVAGNVRLVGGANANVGPEVVFTQDLSAPVDSGSERLVFE